MTAYVRGLPEFRAATARLSAAVDGAAAEAVGKGAHLVQGNAQKLLTAKAHGRGTPTPSAPGEPPATVTGNLKRSIQVEGPTMLGFGTYKAQTGPTIIYGRAQELGTDRLPARPYMAPALTAAMPELEALFTEAWRTAMAL